MKQPKHTFVRIAQGLLAALLIFQGFEFLQNPTHLIKDIPTLNRLSQERMERKHGKKQPDKAQSPELRLFPELNKATPAKKPDATSEAPPNTANATAKAPVPPPAPAVPPAPPPADDHGNYLDRALEAGYDVIGFGQVQEAVGDEFTRIIDAREDFEYEAGHVPGAKSVPFEVATRKGSLKALKEHTVDFTLPTIVYCGDQFCNKAFDLTGYLRDQGHPQVSLYAEGFSDWQNQGGEIETSVVAPASPSTTNATGTASTTNSASANPGGITPMPERRSPGARDVPTDGRAFGKVLSSQNWFELSKYVVPFGFILLGLLTIVAPVGTATWIIRFVLAALFIYNGLLKLKAPGVFAGNIACYLQVPSTYINMLAFVLPPLEILAGLALLIPYLRHAAAFIIFAMLVMFIGATSVALWNGLEISCGCANTNSRPLEWAKVGKNIIFAVSALALLFWKPGKLSGDPNLKPS